MSNQQDTAETILTKWAKIKQDLETFYRKRNQENIDAMMKHAINLFTSLLYITNGKDEEPKSKQPIPYTKLSIKPINLEERLEFIKKRPGLFHAFRQLAELFNELEKLYVIQTIKKSSRNNS